MVSLEKLMEAHPWWIRKINKVIHNLCSTQLPTEHFKHDLWLLPSGPDQFHRAEIPEDWASQL
jgi:hypothetical protein